MRGGDRSGGESNFAPGFVAGLIFVALGYGAVKLVEWLEPWKPESTIEALEEPVLHLSIMDLVTIGIILLLWFAVIQSLRMYGGASA